jgi:hypothetical protein
MTAPRVVLLAPAFALTACTACERLRPAPKEGEATALMPSPGTFRRIADTKRAIGEEGSLAMRFWIMGSLLLVVLGLAGCSGSSGANTAASTSAGPAAANRSATTAQAAPAQPIAVPANASPDYVVTVFLNSLRSGDSPTTESLLTSKARQELARHSLSVDVQSAPNATYQVRPAEVLKGDSRGAHVSSVWTEKFDDGEETYEIVWALRRQAEGWRLAGMAMELIPGQPMQFLNFEDPEDMLRKKDEAIASMQAPAAETAQQPQTGTPGQRPLIER